MEGIHHQVLVVLSLLLLVLFNVHGDLSTQRAGPFDTQIQQVIECPEEARGTQEIRNEGPIKSNKLNRTTFQVSINLRLEDEYISDDCDLGIHFSQITNQGVKPNFLNQNMGPACKAINQYVPDFAKAIEDYFRKENRTTTCPFPPGVFPLNNIPLTFKVKSLKTFFYGHYFIDLNFTCDKKVRGCFRLMVDVFPKRSKG